MPNLRDIQKRINSVQGTKQITRTMEMVAAAKIRRAMERIAAATPYSDSMMETLGSMAQNVSTDAHPLLVTHEEIRHIVVIAISSDRGLAGGFNSNVLRAVDHFVAQRTSEGIEVDIIACGKKAIAYFNYRKLPMIMEFRDLSADPTIDEAKEITSLCIDSYVNDKIDKVMVFYNHARTVADQDLVEEQVLPIKAQAIVVDSENQKSGGGERARLEGEYTFEPSAEAVLSQLLPAYVETRIYYALTDSAAGEQGARRRAMKAATDNATEIVSALTRVYNRARQGAITTEITEIVGGAAALED